MIKTILVRAADDASEDAVYAATRCVARHFGAHVDALHVRVDPVEVAAALSADGAGGMLLETVIAEFEHDADANEARARSRFTTFCEAAGLSIVADPAGHAERPSAMLHVETGQEACWMCTYGRSSDLIITPRGTPNEAAVARATLEALLFETGRPVLIPATTASSPEVAKHVAIAWKATPEAARAVAFAMPFLVGAAKITILSVEEDGQRDEAARLVRYLGCHRISASLERLSAGRAGAAATLLAAAKERSGLLVMGGYGHTRLREWVFGGFTQEALDHAELPVLMVH